MSTHSHRRRAVVAAAAALAMLTAVVGCTSDEGTGTSSSAGGSSPKKVTLVTYDSFALPEKAAAAFEKATGAEIEVRAAGDAGAMLSKALLSAGAPEGDVIFGVDNTLAGRVTAEDLLVPFTPKEAADVPDALKLTGEPGRLLTPIDTGDVCVNADSQWFREKGIEPPRTFADLADPRYKDLLVTPSPVTSSPGLAFLVGTVANSGEDAWSRYWEQLRANGVKIRPSWGDAWNTDYTVSGGDRPLVVSYASSPPAEVVFSEGKVTEPRSVVLTDTCVSQVEYAGVLKGAPNEELGKQLVSFMLSPEWQSELPLNNFVFPAVPGTPLPEEFTKWAARPAEPLTVPAARIAAERDAWVEQWRSIME
ncbi:MAG: thiamine ABC transporter substrate-binding protein [Microthrixaceae bacterium]